MLVRVKEEECLNLRLNGEVLEEVDAFKYLGMEIKGDVLNRVNERNINVKERWCRLSCVGQRCGV